LIHYGLFYINFDLIKNKVKYFIYLIFPVVLSFVCTLTAGNEKPMFLKNGHQERFTDYNSLQWLDFRGKWNIDKNFVHPSGTEANLPDHPPLFVYFPMFLNTKNWYLFEHFYCPPKNKFMSLTYLPPPVTG
jgi:hypothetical protein